MHLIEMNLTEQTHQRIAIAKDLLKNSMDSLIEVGDRSEGTQRIVQDLSVALYELEKLSQDLKLLTRR